MVTLNILGDTAVAALLIVIGWSAGITMATPKRRTRPAKLDGPSATHPALDGPLGVIADAYGVRR